MFLIHYWGCYTYYCSFCRKEYTCKNKA